MLDILRGSIQYGIIICNDYEDSELNYLFQFFSDDWNTDGFAFAIRMGDSFTIGGVFHD